VAVKSTMLLAAVFGWSCTLASDPVDQTPVDAAASVGESDAALEDRADAGELTALLTGSASAPQLGFGEPVDLSSAGPADWAHWGLEGDLGAFNHRSGVAQPISTFTQLGAASLLATNCCIETGFSWSEGTPAATASNAIGGVYVDTANASGDGFRFSVPAGTARETIRIYTGNWCVRARLEATLSDGSAPPLVDTSFDVPTPVLQNSIYTIDVRAGSPDQTLLVDLTIDENHCIEGDVGELHLFAVVR